MSARIESTTWDEILRENARILLPRLRLEPKRQEDPVLEGAGVLMLTADHSIQIDGAVEGGMLQACKLHFHSADLDIGSVVPQDRFYDLQAETATGLAVRVDDVLPRFGSHSRATFMTFSHRCSQAFIGAGAAEWEGARTCSVWLKPLPAVMDARMRDTRSEWPPPAESLLWRRRVGEYIVKLRRVHDYLVVDVRAIDRTALRGDIPEKVEEAASYAFGIKYASRVVEICSETHHTARLRALPDPTIGMYGPFRHQHAWHHLPEVLQVFDKYMAFAFTRRDSYHELSVHLRDVIGASVLDLDVSLRALCLLVECAKGLLDPGLEPISQSDQERIRAAIRASGCGDLAMRKALSRIGGLGYNSTTDVLRHLVARGVITPPQLRAWQSVRNRLMHGRFTWTSDPAETQVRNQHSLVDMCHALVCEIIGYDGPRTDYSSPGQPLRASGWCSGR